MADEAMEVLEVNGENSSDLKINGGECDSDNVKNVGAHSKDIGDVEMPENVIHDTTKSEGLTESSIKSRLENSSGKTVAPTKHADQNEPLHPPLENTNGQNHTDLAAGDTSSAPAVRSLKRKASSSPILDDDADEEELTGFEDQSDLMYNAVQVYKLVDKLTQELLTAEKVNKPPLGRQSAKRMNVLNASPAHSTETPSRPSSGLSFRSDGSSIEPNRSAAESPSTISSRSRKANPELSNPLYRVPFERGWKRELVYRAQQDPLSKRQGDIYYYAPSGKKLRSTREVSEHLVGSDLTIENFTFFKEPLGIDDPDKEIIRDAKAVRLSRSDSSALTVDSPIAIPTSPVVNSLIREGKRTPKPKGPKGASPERGVSPKVKTLKVKSLGSRLSVGAPLKESPLAANSPKPSRKSVNAAGTIPWKQKKTEEEESPVTPAAKKIKIDTATPKEPAVKKPAVTPKAGLKAVKSENGTPGGKRGRSGRNAEIEQKDHFAEFYKENQERGYNSVVQIFQYLKMRELSAAARVCRLWRDIAATPALWTSVRMKNSQVNNWQGLALALKRHGTRHLDLRKMLLPAQVPDQVWEEFTQHIATVQSLARIDLCRCPASVVERVCSGLSQLRALTASSIRCLSLDPAPLANLTHLQELRIKGMTGLQLTSSLKCLEKLTSLKHLSLTSVKDLGKCGCESVGTLTSLESLELGECSLEGGQGTKLLSKLVGLCRLRLEKSPSEEDTPALIFAAATLPKLTHLELINFDIRAGFEKALGECKNVKRLLIIPTYVSQSATTNRCVLDGVLRLKNTLTHLVWGVTIELLRVTELFIVQCDKTPAGGKPKPPPKKNGNGMGDCIPVLKPVPGLFADEGTGPVEATPTGGPPQVEILPLTSLQRLLGTELPATRHKILRIPYHATWRQALNDND